MTSMGGSLEFYDFIIFALFGVYFSKVIFPSAEEGSIIPLLQTYGVFAVGYIARPFGGLVLGHLGDTLGRKKAMVMTISIMTVSTLAMGLIPTYAQVGLLSPIVFSLLRVIQGIALGGELPGCISYISEAMPKHRGLACSVVFCSGTSRNISGCSYAVGHHSPFKYRANICLGLAYSFYSRYFFLGY